MKRHYLFWITLIVLFFLIYSTSLTTYFVQDDFWLLSISRVSSTSDIARLFLPESQVVWYRPLSSQLFIAFSHFLFGLNPLFYHVLVFITHVATTYVLSQFLKLLQMPKGGRYIASFFYLIHQVHTISLSWIAAYSFVLGPLLILLMCSAFIKKNYGISFFWGLLGAMTNEINLLAPLFLLPLIYVDSNSFGRKNAIRWLNLIPYLAVFGVVFLLRKSIFPTGVTTELYQLEISSAMLSTMKFYSLRLIGIPLLFDELRPLIQIICISLVVVFLSLILWGISIKWRRYLYLLLLFGWISLVSICPFVLLSQHLAPHYTSYAMIGVSAFFALGLATIKKRSHVGYILTISVFILLQTIGSQWTYQTHWLFQREKLARQLISKKQYIHPIGTEEYFALGANSITDSLMKEFGK